MCSFPRLTLASWEGRKFYCACGLVHRYTNGVFVAVGRGTPDHDMALTRAEVRR